MARRDLGRVLTSLSAFMGSLGGEGQARQAGKDASEGDGDDTRKEPSQLSALVGLVVNVLLGHGERCR